MTLTLIRQRFCCELRRLSCCQKTNCIKNWFYLNSRWCSSATFESIPIDVFGNNVFELKEFKRDFTPEIIPGLINYINERVVENLCAKNFESLTKQNVSLQDIKALLHKFEFIRYTTGHVPKTLTTDDVYYLLTTFRDEKDQIVHLRYLYHKELQQVSRSIFQNINKVKNQARIIQKYGEGNKKSGFFNNNGDLVYGLWHNALGTRIRPLSLNKIKCKRLVHAALFAPKIVVDLEFENYLTPTNVHFAAKDCNIIFAHNRLLIERKSILFIFLNVCNKFFLFSF